jgi:hypothetical protein
MYHRNINIRIPVLVMALIVAIALVPGEMGDALRAFGDVVVAAVREVQRGYGKLFD